LWFYKDIVAGAGWGLLDDQGIPKSVYYYIKRAFQPLAAFLVDKGLDGLDALIINETRLVQSLRIDIKLLSTPNTIIEHYSEVLQIAPDSQWMANVEALLGYFRDVNYSYQFGMLQHQLVSLQIFDTETNELLTEDIYFPDSLHLHNEQTADIITDLIYHNGIQYLELQSDRFLQAVYLDIPKLKVSNNYFHILPGTPKRIPLITGDTSIETVKGYLTALNLLIPIRLNATPKVLDES
jgi:beta-mannosidase